MDDRSLADAERVLHWTWTETGFRARLPRKPRRTGLFVSVVLAVVGYGLLVSTRPEIAALISLIGVLGLTAYVLAVSRGLWWPTIFDEDAVAPTPEEDHRLVDVQVDRVTLRIGRRRFTLAEIEEIRVVEGMLEIVLPSEVYAAPVPRFARRAVAKVLVPFLAQAVGESRAAIAGRRRAEMSARLATAALRDHPRR